MPKEKTAALKGHLCKGAKLYVAVHCECGWKSSTWGATCRASAYAEWRNHKMQHQLQPVYDFSYETEGVTK